CFKVKNWQISCYNIKYSLRMMRVINTEIEDYALRHTTEPSDEINKLVEKADRELEHIGMMSNQIVSGLLRFLIQLSGAQRCLEVGTFVGYTSLRIAEVLPENGELITCDVNERYEAIARS